jgi:hypothetical protein
MFQPQSTEYLESLSDTIFVPIKPNIHETLETLKRLVL